MIVLTKQGGGDGCGIGALAFLGAAAAAVALAPAPAHAQIIELANDSLDPAVGGIISCPCFIRDEEAAAWLDVPCDGVVRAVRVYWESLLGGTPPEALPHDVVVYREGVYPEPGEEVARVTSADFGAVTPGSFQDLPLVDPSTGQGGVAVAAGERIVVSVVFNRNAAEIDQLSTNMDFDGVTPGANAVFSPGIGWRTAESVSVPGDWVLRAEVVCVEEGIGACCLPEESPAGSGGIAGGCVDVAGGAACGELGGSYQGDGAPCALIDCALGVGACCLGARCARVAAAGCAALDGAWTGPGSECPDACAGLCVGDLDGDGLTDVSDFFILATTFGQTVDYAAGGDLDGNARVDVADFFILAQDFGCRND